MASKGGISMTEAQERKLRTIYEALDNSNNRKGVQLADKILKKQKDFAAVQALKGLGLYRLGRHAEAAAVIKGVPIVYEDATIQALSLYYRESNRHGDLCEYYDALLKGMPGNEEILAQLFMAYVRVGNFKKQQQTAMSLHKHFPAKKPYCYWGAMSVFLQGHFGDEKMSQAVFLPLAERMVEKMVGENKVESEAEVRLYLMILLKQKKFTKALEVIRSPQADHFHSRDEQLSYEVQVLTEMSDWRALITLYRTELQKSVENWSYWKGYMDALSTQLSSKTDDSADSGETATVADLHRFICDIHKTMADDGKHPEKSRNLQLAKVELSQRVTADEAMAAQSSSLGIPSLLSQLTDYTRDFAGKPCCFNDVRPYLQQLNSEEQLQFSDFVNETATKAVEACKDSENDKEKISASACKNLAFEVSRLTARHLKLSAGERRDVADELMQCHNNGLPLGKDLLPTEVQYVDDFPLLAAHVLMDNDNEPGGSEVDLFRAIVTLEHAISASPSVAQIRLCLVKLYCRYGAFDPCAIIFNDLDIKHILLESIGYLWSTPVFGLGYFQTASTMAKLLLSLNHDTTEFVISAYRNGTFHKIIEMIEFRESLQKSLQLAGASALFQGVELLTKSNTIEDVVHRYQSMSPIVFPREVAAQWLDLRDVYAMHDWSPPSARMSEEQKTSSFQLESLWVELRTSVIRSVCCMCSAAATFASPAACVNGNGARAAAATAETRTDDLEQVSLPRLGSEDLAAKARAMDSGGVGEASSLVTNIERLCEEASRHPSLRAAFPLAGPHQPEMAVYLDGCHGSIHTAALVIAITTHNLLRPKVGAGAGVGEADMLDAVRKSTQAMCCALQDSFAAARNALIVDDGSSRRFVGAGLAPLVYVVESLSNIAFLLSCANYFVTCARGTSKKARKKKPTGVVGELLDLLGDAHLRITGVMADVQEFVTAVLGDIQRKDLSSVSASVVEQMPELYKPSVDKALKHINDSHCQAVVALRDVLAEKIPALAAAKL